MALARVTIWNAGDVLTAAALNGEFNNILNNPLTLVGNLSVASNFNSGLNATSTTFWRGDGSWSNVPIAAPWAVVRAFGKNNSTNPTTQYDLASDIVVLRRPSDLSTVQIVSSSTATVDLTTAGPVINGRDQAGAFSAGQAVHIYYIYNTAAATLAGIVSGTRPPTGPALPAGYNHWAWFGSYMLASSAATFQTQRTFGELIMYDSLTGPNQILSGGTSTAETTVTTTAAVPITANAVHLQLQIQTSGSASAPGVDTLRIRLTSSVNHTGVSQLNSTQALSLFGDNSPVIPNVQSSFLYMIDRNSSGGANPSGSIYVRGYTVSNGN